MFSNTSIEWTENTPFWKNGYISIQDYFDNFLKVTRVIAFVENKKEYKDELKQLEIATLNSASRNDLRVAKVLDKDLVRYYKQKMGLQWFGPLSNNTIVLFKKKFETDDDEVSSYDLSYDSTSIFEFINTKSLQSCDNLNAFSQRILRLVSKPMFVAFINKRHSQYGELSKQLYEMLKQLSQNFPQIVFTYLEGRDFKEKKREMGIVWDDEPALAYSNHSDRDRCVYPKERPFTKVNIENFINSCLSGKFGSSTKSSQNSQINNKNNMKTDL